jgi:putative ABC transport system permease protein
MLQDLRLALRGLRLQLGFSIVAVLTLALGVGATTAIFSAVNAVALKPLPFRQPEDLYRFRTEMTDGRITTGAISQLELTRLNEMRDIVESATGALRYEGSLVDKAGNPIRAVMQGVAPRFFTVFGVPMAAGRDFTPEELGPGGPFAAIISHRAWRTWFGEDRSIIGQSVTMEGGPVPLVGVAGEGFNFPGGADVWFTIKFATEGTGHAFDGFVRLKPGVTIERARAAFEPLALRLQKDFPAANANRVFGMQPLLDAVVGPLGPTLIVILAASGLLLLVACVNVTSLMLSRGVVRARDVAVRVALGAGRWRIFRQLLTESLVLAVVGAAAGLGLAWLGLTLMLRVGASQLPRLDGVALDGPALVFALAATIGTGLIVGFAPALRLARTDVKSLVNETGRGGTSGRATHRLLHGLVVAEIAMAVVLTIGAALLVKSFWNLQQTDAGFRPQGRIVFEVSLPVQSYDDWTRISDWYGALLERIRVLPGVVNAGAISSAPLGPELDTVITFWDARTGMPSPEQRPRARRRSVSPEFFKAAGVSMVAGRAFAPTDRRDTPGVAIVDEVFVRQNFPNGNAIGSRIVFRATPAPVQNPIGIVRPADAEIVGVVRSVRFASVGADPEPTIYLPIEQVGRRQLIVVAETALQDPAGLIAGVRRAVRDADPTLSVTYYDMGRLVERALTRERLSMTLLSLFGVGALVLAAVGIYGIMSYSIAQRRGEFAVRAALGAEPSGIRGLVLAQGRKFGLIGAAIGLGIAAAAGRWVESQLYGVSALDPLVLAAMTALMLVVVLGSTLVPAWRASKVKASHVLRAD